jgi:hypothetical protein
MKEHYAQLLLTFINEEKRVKQETSFKKIDNDCLFDLVFLSKLNLWRKVPLDRYVVDFNWYGYVELVRMK